MMKKSMQEQLDSQYCRPGYMFQGMKDDGTPDCASIGAMYGTDGGTPPAPKAPESPTPPEGASEIDDEIAQEAKRRTSRNNTRVNANGVVQQGTSMGNG